MGKKSKKPSSHRLVLLGNGGVGKSSLTVRFVQGDFHSSYDPTIEDSYTFETAVDGVAQSLEIMDTAGSEQFGAMHNLYMRNGDLFILVYDVTSRKTFEDVVALRDELLRTKGSDDVLLLLVGNKCDLKVAVEQQRADEVARQWRCPHFLTSAKSGINVSEMFHKALRLCIEARARMAQKPPASSCVLL